MVRAYVGMAPILSARIRLTVLAPNAAMIAIASRIPGIAYKISSARMMTLSVLRP
ncbi:hypothetical protein D3C85_1490670 [compost metagenome]